MDEAQAGRSRGFGRHSGRVAAVCGSLVAACGLWILAAWIGGRQDLLGAPSGQVPMAPNTAISLCLLGFAVAVSPAGFANRRRRFRLVLAASGAAAALSLLTLFDRFAGVPLDVDHWFITPPAASIDAGHMSAVTAVCLLAIGAGMTAIAVGWQKLATVIGGTVVLSAWVIVTGYWFDAPLLYGLGIVPVAHSTALACLVLGMGLLAARRTDWPLGELLGTATSAMIFRRFVPGLTLLALIAVYSLSQAMQSHGPTLVYGVVGIVLGCVLGTGLLIVRVSRTTGRIIESSDEARQQSEERFRVLFEQAADIILLLEDVPGSAPIIRDANAATFRILGFDRAELLDRPVSILAVAPDSLEAISRRLGDLSVETGARTEIRHPCRNGKIRDFECSLRRIRIGSKSFAISVERDITDRKQAEAVARQHQKLESIGTLASGVAHEINNPLNVIMNYGQLIADEPSSPDFAVECAGQIVKESERVAAIVRNLLAFSRQESEPLLPARMADIVDQALSLTQAALRKDQIAVLRDVPDDLPPIRCRAQQIQQVLMNLVTNARDSLNERWPKGGADKTLRISAQAIDRNGDPWLRLSVEDRGAGIPAETRDRIFEPFFSTKGRLKGTGLGLSISYGIVQEHHGEIGFESEPGQGTRFHVDLPIGQAALRIASPGA